MVKVDRKKDTYINWKYAVIFALIPIGFYLISFKENIESFQHLLYIAIIIWLAIAGVFGVTNPFSSLRVYGYLYLISSIVFAYMGLVLIW